MIERLELEQKCEGMHLPEGDSECTHPMNVQQLGHLCQLIHDTQESLQELVTLGASLRKLPCQQRTEVPSLDVTVVELMACKSIIRPWTRKRYLSLGSGFEGAQSFDLGGYGMVEVVEGYEGYGRLLGRLANGPEDHLLGTELNRICSAGSSVAGFGMILMTGGGTMVDGLSGGGSVDTDSTIEGRPAKELGGETERGQPG